MYLFAVIRSDSSAQSLHTTRISRWNGVPHQRPNYVDGTCPELAHTLVLHLTNASVLHYNAGACYHRPALSHCVRYHCHHMFQKTTSILHWCYPRRHTSCGTTTAATSLLHLTVGFLLCTGATHQIPRPAAGHALAQTSK